MAAPIPRDVHELYPGRTFDPLTQCWVAPGERPIPMERMQSLGAILAELHERLCRARLAADPDAGLPTYTCPRCAAVSYNPGDIEHRYCGRCHRFADDRIDGDGSTF